MEPLTSSHSSWEIEEIISLISRKVGRNRGGKAAIVTFNGVDFGLARMFGTFTELAGLPIVVKVFRSEDVAREWLREADNGGAVDGG